MLENFLLAVRLCKVLFCWGLDISVLLSMFLDLCSGHRLVTCKQLHGSRLCSAVRDTCSMMLVSTAETRCIRLSFICEIKYFILSLGTRNYSQAAWARVLTSLLSLAYVVFPDALVSTVLNESKPLQSSALWACSSSAAPLLLNSPFVSSGQGVYEPLLCILCVSCPGSPQCSLLSGILIAI